MEFPGNFIECYCRKSVDMKVRISIKKQEVKGGRDYPPRLEWTG
jgi:hypothetical protein